VSGVWQPLEEALERWMTAGRKPDFWLRDDDAIEPTAALERLVAQVGKCAIPLTLAVIPAHATEALARALDGSASVTPVVHGWSHENHAPQTQKKQELGPHRRQEFVLNDLAHGLRRIDELFGPRMAPVLVPPWNRIDAALVPHLGSIGFRAVSVFGPLKPSPIRQVNATVDIIDWHGTRGCRDHAALVGEIVAELDAALTDDGRPPVGILTHHLVHDESAWAFLERLFDIASRTDAANWRSIHALLDR
jgi:hypothetical protein